MSMISASEAIVLKVTGMSFTGALIGGAFGWVVSLIQDVALDPSSLVNWGVGGAVIGVVIIFLRYMSNERDTQRNFDAKRDERAGARDDSREERFIAALAAQANTYEASMALLRSALTAENERMHTSIQEMQHTVEVIAQDVATMRSELLHPRPITINENRNQ